MADFSIQDVAFTGFRVVRQHPRALLAWWLFSLVFSMLVGLVFFSLAGADFVKLMAMSRQPTLDPTAFFALASRLAPAYLIFLALALASNAVLGAAMIRAVFRPQDDRLGYLRVGADEARQLGLLALMFLVFTGVYFGVVVVGVMVRVLVAATRIAPDAVLVLLFFGVVAVMLFLAVRLSLAGALTFDTRRINLFGSWSLTRGRFWRLFGTYLLVFALVLVVYLLSLLLIFAVGALLNGGTPTADVASSGAGSLGNYFSPVWLVQTVLGAGVSALITPLVFTPAAAIYRALRPSAGEAFA
ncbi:MAG TPA: hypothetical protein VKQ54_06870 [Caulobacteraceae bacterium]|nr:hypothetical protein [Caulobacteraceae bacterium]